MSESLKAQREKLATAIAEESFRSRDLWTIEEIREELRPGLRALQLEAIEAFEREQSRHLVQRLAWNPPVVKLRLLDSEGA